LSREVAGAPALLPPPPAPCWEVEAPPDRSVVDGLEAALGLPRPLCGVLAVRGRHDPPSAKAFLRPLLQDLDDPSELPDADAAADRIGRAIEAGEAVLVHGDYDADGVCGAALLTRWIRELGGRAEGFVPHRLRDGYDLGPSGVGRAGEIGAGLIVAVDCGTRAVEAVRRAGEEGIDVIVVDHHVPGPVLPESVAFVNPKREGASGRGAELAGTGVAYQLCRLLGKMVGREERSLHAHLDLVALATVADVVPLEGDNRTLVRYGLRALARTTKPGLLALLDETGLEPGELDAGSLGWVLGPRLNAAGRVGEARSALDLLLTQDREEAARLAQDLEARNRTRREEDRRILGEALARLETSYDPGRDYGIVLEGEGWHPGVIGIVASRIVERVHRPTVLLAFDGETGKGSARSIPGFHLARALEGCAEHLERFGGHAQAAGMEVRRDRLDAFREAFRDRARRELEDRELRPRLRIDLELPLRHATPELHDRLRFVGPFGIGNPRPVFLARGVSTSGRAREVGKGHLKLRLTDGNGTLDAIGFGLARRIPPGSLDGSPVDVAFQLRENEYRGHRTLQARILDLKVGGARPEDGTGSPVGSG